MLASARRVIAPDWLGWGASERSLALDCAYEAEVERLARLFDALDLPVVDLAAHDYGGFLGLGFLLRHPGRVRRFAILNSRAHRTFPWRYYQQFALMSLCGGNAWLRPLLMQLPCPSARSIGGVSPPTWEGLLRPGTPRALRRLDGCAGGAALVRPFFAGYRVAIRSELGAGLVHPRPDRWGDRDSYCPFTTAEDLATRMPQVRLHRITGADHYVMEERPREVSAALADWLGQS